MKNTSSSTETKVPARIRRKTMRTCIGMHIDFLADLVKQLDKGAQLDRVLSEWKRDCGAVKGADSLFMESRRKTARS